MKSLFCVLILASASLAQTTSPVPQSADWMVTPTPFPARITEDKNRGELTLENGRFRE